MFASLDDLCARIDDPELEVTADDVLVLQNAGPRSATGMPEAGYLPIPKKLSRAGVKDMVRISDARMSGTAYGTIVLHVAPEAAPADRWRWSDRRQDPAVGQGAPPRPAGDDAELARRRAALKPATAAGLRGYDKLFRESVMQAPDGCDFAFLRR